MGVDDGHAGYAKWDALWRRQAAIVDDARLYCFKCWERGWREHSDFKGPPIEWLCAGHLRVIEQVRKEYGVPSSLVDDWFNTQDDLHL